MLCIPHIDSIAHALVLLLLHIHTHVLISCSSRTIACGLIHFPLHLALVLPGICNTYHYVVRCTPRSHLLLCSLLLLFPLPSRLGVCVFPRNVGIYMCSKFFVLRLGACHYSFRAYCCCSRRTTVAHSPCLFCPAHICCIVAVYALLVSYTTR